MLSRVVTVYICLVLMWKKISLSPLNIFFSSVQSLSHVWLFATPWITARQASLSITNSRSSPKLMSIELVMPSSHLILWSPLLLLPPILPNIRVFSSESTLHMRWPKYWSFSFNISPSNEHPGLISFRIDWLALLSVQGTLKSLLQHHNSKASILRHSAFFTVQLSHPYMTTGKAIALTRRICWYFTDVLYQAEEVPFESHFTEFLGFPGGSAGKESLQYSGLENSMDCIVHGVTKSQTQLRNFHFLSLYWVFIINEGFPGGSDGKESTCNTGDMGLIPGLGRSPGEGNGNLL